MLGLPPGEHSQADIQDFIDSEFHFFLQFLELVLWLQKLGKRTRASFSELSRELGLVVLTEYMSESFVLLRRKMCWNLGDILFASVNAG